MSPNPTPYFRVNTVGTGKTQPQFCEQIKVYAKFDGIFCQKPAKYFKNNAPGGAQIRSKYSFKKYPTEKVAAIFI